MTTTTDPETFETRWTDYIDELNTLKSSMDPDDFDELDAHIEGLKEIVEEAADSVRE